METYRLTASALLRLASLASTASGADAGEIVAILQGATLDAPDVLLPSVEDGPGVIPDKPAKPE